MRQRTGLGLEDLSVQNLFTFIVKKDETGSFMRKDLHTGGRFPC